MREAAAAYVAACDSAQEAVRAQLQTLCDSLQEELPALVSAAHWTLFASTLPAAAIRRVGPRRLGIIPDLRLRDVPFPDRHHSGRTHGFLFDFVVVWRDFPRE